MHDFDYDAMQKKRIARGAMHMKRGSKSKKCSLPHDGLTAAQLRRLNGPVSTYKMDEPMDWEGFILGLKEIGYPGVIAFETFRIFSAYPKAVHTQVLKLISGIGHYWAELIDAPTEE